MTIVLDEGISRVEVMRAMRARGVQTSIHYPPIHQFTFYRTFAGSTDLAHTEALGRRVLTLPLYPGMTYEQVKLVCDCLGEAAEILN